LFDKGSSLAAALGATRISNVLGLLKSDLGVQQTGLTIILIREYSLLYLSPRTYKARYVSTKQGT
jgi:hypothetical protein